MACSARLRVRASYVRADGTSQVYLQIIINRALKWLPLDLYWPAKHFDNSGTGEALPRRRGDKELADLNLQAGQELARANNIFVEWRLRNQDLTLDEFLKEFNSKLNRGNFCDYYHQKLEERYRSEEISDLSYKAQRATLRKLLEFSRELPFANLKAQGFAKKFDLWLEKKKGSSANTRWSRHKDVKTYLHLAQKDSIRFDWPYEDYKVGKVAGKWVAAQPREIELLNTYYDTLPPGSLRRRYLRRWLFGVATGLRLSDQRAAKREWLIENLLVFLMHKGRRKGKLVRLPLGQRAMELIQDALRERDGENGHIFLDATGQKSNEWMEGIRQELASSRACTTTSAARASPRSTWRTGAAWRC